MTDPRHHSNEHWLEIFLVGWAPELPRGGLEALQSALVSGDQRVHRMRGQVAIGHPGDASGPIRSCDAVGYALWRGLALETVDSVFAALAARPKVEARLKKAGKDEWQAEQFRAWFSFAVDWDATRRLLADAIWALLAEAPARKARAAK